jgi:hypothetical protein
MTRYLPAVARILLGLIFLIMGLNGFFYFIPAPKTPMPTEAMAFAMALDKTGYMNQLISATGIVVAVLLLLNIFVPLALAVIAPVIVNIIAYHVFLDFNMIAPGAVVAALEIYLAWAYRKSFLPMLAMRVTPY